MTTIRKIRRMARDPNPQGGEGAPADGNGEISSISELANSSDPKPARVTKQRLLIEMLSREGGATLTAIVGSTGWLPHTARAALTGLRKKGHPIERFRREGETTYRIVVGPAAASAAGSNPALSAGETAETRTDGGFDSSAAVDADGGPAA